MTELLPPHRGQTGGFITALLKIQRSVMNIKKGGLRILVFQNLTLTLAAVLIL